MVKFPSNGTVVLGRVEVCCDLMDPFGASKLNFGVRLSTRSLRRRGARTEEIPKERGANVPAHYTSCAGHGSLTNPHIRQDDAVRTDEDILFDDNSSVAFWPFGPPVGMSEGGVSRTDGAIVANRDFSGMQFINPPGAAKAIFPTSLPSSEGKVTGSYLSGARNCIQMSAKSYLSAS